MWRGVFLLAACVCRGAAICGTDAPEPDPVPVADPADFERNVAAFAALRSLHEGDVSLHERYQDAVRRYGIEGHLKAMGEEYQLLAAQHPGELLYRYLAARALLGRGTHPAVESLTAIAREYPGFAPARCALDGVATMVPPVPEPSPLLDRAEGLLHANGDPHQIEQMAATAIRADEWRLQRIRAFDWYSPELKRQTLREMQSEYWRLWDLQVRCWRRSGQIQKAQELLTEMRRRAAILNDPFRLAQVDRLGR